MHFSHTHIPPCRPVRSLHPDDLDGDGVFSSIKNFFSGPRKQAPPKVRNFLSEHSNDHIVKAYVSRTPLKAPLAAAANYLTKGKYEKKRKEAGYDDFYHTSLIFELANGKKFRLEKNAVVEISDFKPKNEQVLPLNLSKPISVVEMVKNAESYQQKDDKRPNFWTYDAQNNNCQYFVDDIIKGNPDIQHPEKVEKFTLQPEGKEAIEDAKGAVKFVTDLAARADHAIHGTGASISKIPQRMNPVQKEFVRKIGKGYGSDEDITGIGHHSKNPRVTQSEYDKKRKKNKHTSRRRIHRLIRQQVATEDETYNLQNQNITEKNEEANLAVLEGRTERLESIVRGMEDIATNHYNQSAIRRMRSLRRQIEQNRNILRQYERT